MTNVSVIGAGTMGNGIAHLFAQHGYKVNLIDISELALQKALGTIEKNLQRQLRKELIEEGDIQNTLANISTATSLDGSIEDSDLIIEAASEDESVKFNIFKTINELAHKSAILATNTSSISITKIATATSRPENLIGMHFFNPVPVMKLVEVIRGYNTSDETTKTIMELSQNLGKIPVEVNDYPGFVANRILMPMINEAIQTLQMGVAGVEEIDTVMKLGMAHPMGPLQLADFVGLDVCLNICKVLQEGLGDNRYAPAPLLVNMVMAGKLGRKSSEGFYDYGHGGKELIVSKSFAK